MPSNSEFDRGFKSKAERIAQDFRVQMGLSVFKPLCAYKLAEHIKIPIFTVEDVFSENESHPHFTRLKDTSKFDALWMCNEDDDKVIIHNKHHSKFRQQSNLMHELSHIILGHTVPDEIGKLCLQFNLHYYSKKHELEAKFLGGCLQITTPAIRWVKKENWSEERISEHFTASPEMVDIE